MASYERALTEMEQEAQPTTSEAPPPMTAETARELGRMTDEEKWRHLAALVGDAGRFLEQEGRKLAFLRDVGEGPPPSLAAKLEALARYDVQIKVAPSSGVVPLRMAFKATIYVGDGDTDSASGENPEQAIAALYDLHLARLLERVRVAWSHVERFRSTR